MREAPVTGVTERIGQDQTSLSIRVDHLDRLAVHSLDDIARTLGRPAWYILRRRDDSRHIHRQLERRDPFDRGEDRRPAGHVALHRLHPLARLDRDPSRIEGQRLPYQAEARTRPFPLSPLVAALNELRGLLTSLSHPQERPHA